MSAMNIDRPLDDMVTESKKARKQQRGPKKAAPAARPAAPRGAATAGTSGAGGRRQQQQVTAEVVPGDRVIVSNLPDDVTEQQVKDLFAKTIGPVGSAQMNYDARGKPKGVVNVQFRKPEDAARAFEQYNNRLIDGKRALRVEIVYDPTKRPLASRLGVTTAKGKAASATVAAASGGAGGGRPARAAGQGRGGRGKRGGERSKVTAEALDADMADWQKEGEKAAAAK